MKRRTFLGYSITALGVLALTLILGWWRVDGPGARQSDVDPSISLSSMDFRLNNHRGEAVGPDTLMGRVSMVFFGFTHCPDICPTTLSDISSWLDALGSESSKLNVVFITVDPTRDTTKALAEYVSFFHPAIDGWTGSEKQIANAAADFRIRYEKVKTNGDDYSMNHSASIFLLNQNGTLVSTIDYHETKVTALQKIRRVLGKPANDLSSR